MKQKTSPLESPWLLWTLSLLFLIVWFYMLGARVLVPTDEGRYAEMAREMVASGDWITQRLNGIKYFEKPPLQNWMNAITFEFFGLGDWQARLWTGLCGLLGIGLTAHAGAKLFSRRVGIIAGLVLASSFYWAGFGHINSLDMGLSGMTTLALYGLLVAQRDGASEKENLYGMLACWAGMALAVLSKGLIGVVLPGAVLVLYTMAVRDLSLWKRLHLSKGLLLFFLIAAPWFVLVWQKNPEHPHFFFIHEHWERFTTPVHHRGGAWYYFVPFLILGMIPWLGTLVQSLWLGIRDENKASHPGFQPKKLLLIWTVFFFVFFSVSDSKLPSYILPIFPSLALLVACYLNKAATKVTIVNALLLAMLGVAGLILSYKLPSFNSETYEAPFFATAVPWAYAASAVFVIGGILAAYLAKRQKDHSLIVLAVCGFVGGQLAFMASAAWGEYSAGSLYVPTIQAELKPDTPIYAVGRYEQSLPFYLGRTVTLVEHPDEMEFGLGIQHELWIPKREDFITKWRADSASGKPAIAILRTDVYADMQKQGVPMRVIVEDPKRVIVSDLLQK